MVLLIVISRFQLGQPQSSMSGGFWAHFKLNKIKWAKTQSTSVFKKSEDYAMFPYLDTKLLL
jgi:hypothetical protein